ncbi:RAD55 family ATPase [Methanobacterium spitsbergense]|uniref:RAD55 family ATPase n=1 Tax=Methanobacterium spitsbergense TaxID=2874285 RepID=A0A8T5V4F3_9EURY|nr:RAD55 family ATPase [Methanobacterium spitsbergense]MBZ2166555.1 RAD55 family ATPase [Methanobacterium spitsbergense]
MIPFIESGIPGFDELTKSENGIGGIPENTATLIYGPAKTGKTIFTNQFTYKGLLNGEPCLYITTDQGAKQLEINMNDFQLPVEKYLNDESFYIIDTISEISNENQRRSKSIIPSYINNPTDIMVKVGSGIHFVYKNNPRFRSVLDSSTTLLAYNDNKLIIRVLKAYLMRIYEAGGTSIITYTEDSADRIVETMLKSIVDNIIRLDYDELTVEAMKGVGKRISPYKITEKGIVL